MNRSFQAVFVLLGLLGAAVAAIGRPEQSAKPQPKYAPLREKVSLTAPVTIDPTARPLLATNRETTVAILPVDRSPTLLTSDLHASIAPREISASIGYEGSCGLDAVTGEIYSPTVAVEADATSSPVTPSDIASALGMITAAPRAELTSENSPLVVTSRVPHGPLRSEFATQIDEARAMVLEGQTHLVLWKRADHEIVAIDHLDVSTMISSSTIAGSVKLPSSGSMIRLADDFFPLLSLGRSLEQEQRPLARKREIPREKRDNPSSSASQPAHEQAHAESTSTGRLMLLSATRRQVDGLFDWLMQSDSQATIAFYRRGITTQLASAVDRSGLEVVLPLAIRERRQNQVGLENNSHDWSDYEAATFEADTEQQLTGDEQPAETATAQTTAESR